ncbi:NAD(P)/FAD-dependent oxidoreductase [Dactylosporangium sp. McL0621]|uniref:NAD(P)/FAD-dependent oxidoreductase n=1 Tax=Dactylosporangium sp. McL0621 TaxID=3415678 RepID=UPI003CEA61F8
MAEALTTRGLTVTLLEQVSQVMPTVDPQLAEPLAEHLRERGVAVHTGTTVLTVGRAATGLVVGTDRGDHHGDLVLVVTGVRPDIELAANAGATLGVRGAIAACAPTCPTSTRPATASTPTTASSTRTSTCPSAAPPINRAGSPGPTPPVATPSSPARSGRRP